MLRAYQQKAVDAGRTLQRAGIRRWIYVSPTGSGKTVLACEGWIKPAVVAGKKVMFVVHLREVVRQASRKLEELGIEHGIVLSGKRPMLFAPVQVCSIQTLSRRDLPHADLIILDECHRANAPQYRRLVEAYPSATIIGLTATPVRGDGKGLGKPRGPFERMIVVCHPEQLIREGHLVPPRVYGLSSVDLSRIRIDKKTHDYDEGDLDEHYVGNSALLGDAVSEWHRLAHGRKSIVFAVNRRHAKLVYEAYRKAGVEALYIDGETKISDRDKISDSFSSGKKTVIVNVNVLVEGYDEPTVGAIQCLRPTLSMGRWIQMVGRGLRPSPGKRDVVVLDHAGNASRHGLPTETREWSLGDHDVTIDGLREAAAGHLAQQWMCPQCRVIRSLEESTCLCGYARGSARVPRVVPGQLSEVRV